MAPNKDYARMTSEELKTAEKRAHTERIVHAVIIAVLLSALIYGGVTKGFGLVPTGFPLVMIVVFFTFWKKSDQKIQDVRSELKKKSG